MIKVSCVKYTNSLPFIRGLSNSTIKTKISLSLDTPAESYEKLMSGMADIALAPVVALKSLENPRLISNYGIGANGKVCSVILVSPSEKHEIRQVYLDYQSKTSVRLSKLIFNRFWKLYPRFENALPGFEDRLPAKGEAYVIIGDRSFSFYNSGLNIIDLGEEWKIQTCLPFVFATWISRIDPGDDFTRDFDIALEAGLSERDAIITEIKNKKVYEGVDLRSYFYSNINYNFNSQERKGMELFLNLLQ